MKQYSVEYWGFMTILAESEDEARAKFAKVDHGEDSDYAEIETIDYVCEVYKHTPRISASVHSEFAGTSSATSIEPLAGETELALVHPGS
jgi:hypothetical protein